MSEYISRDKAIDAIVQYLGRIKRDFKNWQCTARIILEYVPSEDVQPVVYCKDCVYWSSKDTRYCNMLQGTFQENDFCSHGKRKGADE